MMPEMVESLNYALHLIDQAAETGIERLDLGGLDLQQLPKEIGRLTNLTHLSLRGNSLVDLPEEIGRLPALHQLSLADNNLQKLPESFSGLTRLTHLNLKNNDLRELPHLLLELKQLESLQLAGNPLPLPDEVIARWNRPQEILDYYREHCIEAPTPPPPNIDYLVARYFDEESIDHLWQELAIPVTHKPAGGSTEKAAALVAYHFRHGLAEELRELMQIIIPHINWNNAVYVQTPESTNTPD